LKIDESRIKALGENHCGKRQSHGSGTPPHCPSSSQSQPRKSANTMCDPTTTAPPDSATIRSLDPTTSYTQWTKPKHADQHRRRLTHRRGAEENSRHAEQGKGDQRKRSARTAMLDADEIPYMIAEYSFKHLKQTV
jgi:hypothetical protein